MKKKIEEITQEEKTNNNGKTITRADAIKKVGYIAVSAATMMILLSSPNKAMAVSPATLPEI